MLIARERELRFGCGQLGARTFHLDAIAIELGLADEATLEQALRALKVEIDLRVFAAHARELRARRADVELRIDGVELRDRMIAMHAAADFDETLRDSAGDAEADSALIASADFTRVVGAGRTWPERTSSTWPANQRAVRRYTRTT